MYYHVIENVQREGKPVYLVAKTYQRMGNLMRYLRKSGKPVWILSTWEPGLTVSKHPSGFHFLGGHDEAYWNSGAGTQVGYMPVLPVVFK